MVRSRLRTFNFDMWVAAGLTWPSDQQEILWDLNHFLKPHELTYLVNRLNKQSERNVMFKTENGTLSYKRLSKRTG